MKIQPSTLVPTSVGGQKTNYTVCRTQRQKDQTALAPQDASLQFGLNQIVDQQPLRQMSGTALGPRTGCQRSLLK